MLALVMLFAGADGAPRDQPKCESRSFSKGQSSQKVGSRSVAWEERESTGEFLQMNGRGSWTNR